MKTFRVLLLVGLLILVLSVVVAKGKYPKTAPCPVDGATAKATGKTIPTMDAQCVSVEYQHKGTDYTNRTHPQRFKHEFWLTVCNDTANVSPSK